MAKTRFGVKAGLVAGTLLAVSAWYNPWAGLSSPASAETSQQAGKTGIDWVDGIIRVTGSGAPPNKGGAAQKRLMTKRAAQADGYRQLAEAINGVHVDSETSVKDFVTESDVIKTRVSALVKGAMPVATRNLSDGSIEVDMEAKLYGSNGLLGVVAPWENRKPGPPPTVQVPAEQSVLPTTLVASSGQDFRGLPMLVADVRYSGVIIDARGMGLEPAMSPSILDPGKGELYLARNKVDPDYVVNEGIASWYTTLEQGRGDRERVGSNPLVIKARRVSGTFRCDTELGTEQAIAVLLADRKGKVLQGARVGFVY